jgi:hypothetical protein
MGINRGSILLQLFLFFSLSLNAQLVRDLPSLYHPSSYYSNRGDTSSFEPRRMFKPGQTNYSLEVGTGFASFGRGNGFSTSFISPTVSFSPTERLQIVAGGKFSYSNFNSTQMFNVQPEQVQGDTPAVNPTEAFAYGRYLISNRLSVYGMGAIGKNQIYISPYSLGVGTTDYQHFSFGMDFKISEKATIGASFGVTNGPAWNVSPFGNYSNRTWSPFFP